MARIDAPEDGLHCETRSDELPAADLNNGTWIAATGSLAGCRNTTRAFV
jgi:hypothetical protein